MANKKSNADKRSAAMTAAGTAAGTAVGAKKNSGKIANTMNDAQPDWASGLRQLYNQVVEEPLPDSFKDLLSKLDDKRA